MIAAAWLLAALAGPLTISILTEPERVETFQIATAGHPDYRKFVSEASGSRDIR